MKSLGAGEDSPKASGTVCLTCMWWEEPVLHILVTGRTDRVAVVCADCLGTGLPDARGRLAALLIEAREKEGEKKR